MKIFTKKNFEDEMLSAAIIYLFTLFPYQLIWWIWKVDVLGIFFNFIYRIFN